MVILKIFQSKDSEEANATTFYEGDHLVGYDTFLESYVNKVFVKDALIHVGADGVTLKSVSIYTCLFKSPSDRDPWRLEKNSCVTLENGAQFCLPFGMTWYKVKIILNNDSVEESGTSQNNLASTGVEIDAPKRSLDQSDSNEECKRLKTHDSHAVETNINSIASTSAPSINTNSLINSSNFKMNDYHGSTNQSSDRSNGNEKSNGNEQTVSSIITPKITNILVNNSIFNGGYNNTSESRIIDGEKNDISEDVSPNAQISTATKTVIDQFMHDDISEFMTENENCAVSIIENGENAIVPQQLSSIETTPHEIAEENKDYIADEQEANNDSSFENLSVKSEPLDEDSSPESALSDDGIEEETPTQEDDGIEEETPTQEDDGIEEETPTQEDDGIEEETPTQEDDSNGSCSSSDSGDEMEGDQYLSGQICHRASPAESRSSHTPGYLPDVSANPPNPAPEEIAILRPLAAPTAPKPVADKPDVPLPSTWKSDTKNMLQFFFKAIVQERKHTLNLIELDELMIRLIDEKLEKLVAKRAELAAERSRLTAEREQLVARRAELASQRAELNTKFTELKTPPDDPVAQRAEYATKSAELAKERAALACTRAELASQRADLASRRAESLRKLADIERREAEHQDRRVALVLSNDRRRSYLDEMRLREESFRPIVQWFQTVGK